MLNQSGSETIFTPPGFQASSILVSPRFVNSKGEKVKRETMPIPVWFSGLCGPLLRASVKSAAEKWGDASKGKVSFKFVTKKPQWFDYAIGFDAGTQNGWIGDEHVLATTWFPAGIDAPHIQYTNTTFNMRVFKWHRGNPAYAPAKSNKLADRAQADFDAVSLHELGHAIGLPHSENPKDIMYQYIHEGDGSLTVGDIKLLLDLYS